MDDAINYVTYDEAGNLTGGYIQPVRLEHQSAFIEVSEEVRASWVKYLANDERNGVVPSPEVAVASNRTMLASQIDDRVAAVYARYTRFESEYGAREAAARAFKAAGYIGDASLWVTSFADAAGLGSAMAADMIIAQADNLRAAQVALGAQRMRKYLVVNAASNEEATGIFNQIIAAVDYIAGTLS